jgi:ribosome biogenesis GTPase
MEATVLWGANNIFTVRSSGASGTAVHEHLRLKGKILDSDQYEHNPLAPGDVVELAHSGDGDLQIISRRPRINAVTRWNPKRQTVQTVAANVDRLFVVTSAGEPRYRSQFIDRVLVMASLEEITAAVIVNKADLPLDSSAQQHIAVLRDLGYDVFFTVADPGEEVPQVETDLETVASLTDGATVALFGQSGVGKSSLINRLIPGANQTVGDVSVRYDRGRHTTTLAKQVIATAGHGPVSRVCIDTPGVREYSLAQYEVTEIAAGFREFRSHIPGCRMPSCTHLHEPGCAVLTAVEAGTITRERYDSYRQIITTGPERMV